MTQFRLISFYFCSLILLGLSTIAYADEPVSKSFMGGVAIDGHDSFAYHSKQAVAEHKEEKGTKKYTVKYKGAKWHFASQENADEFEANPEKYSPAYNGHCANALSLDKGLLKTDGTHWEIFDDQLYLFYAAEGRARWMDGNFESYKIDADQAWQKIITI